MAAQHDAWLDGLETSHIQPLDDNWQNHPFWADEADMKNPETAAGKVIEEMQSEFSPEERAESCKVRIRTSSPDATALAAAATLQASSSPAETASY